MPAGAGGGQQKSCFSLFLSCMWWKTFLAQLTHLPVPSVREGLAVNSAWLFVWFGDAWHRRQGVDLGKSSINISSRSTPGMQTVHIWGYYWTDAYVHASAYLYDKNNQNARCLYAKFDGSAVNGGKGKHILKRQTLKAYSIRYSQAVTHPSTNGTRRCLTSLIGREPVFSTWYSHRHFQSFTSRDL